MNIYNLREAFAELELNAELETDGILTPWESFNKTAGSMQPGDLIVLSAPPKFGKTTLALEICIHNIRQGIPCLFFCLEARPPRLLKRVIANVVRVETSAIGKTEIALAKAKLFERPLYFGWCKQAISPDDIYKILNFAVRRLGIKLLVFDHLQFLIRSVDNTTQETSNASRNFKFLAEELQIPIILIAHPKKIKLDKPMNYYDLRDSSSVPGDADRIWLMHRRRVAVETDDDGNEHITFSKETSLYVEASRWSESGGRVELDFISKYLHFKEREKKKDEGSGDGRSSRVH
jgi:replicative DNA helicase